MTSVLDAVGRQGLRLLDGLVLLWVVLWVVLGAWTGHEIRQLTLNRPGESGDSGC